MRIKTFAAYGALVGGMSLAALGFGAGFAHAETGTIVPGTHEQTTHQIEQNEQQTTAPSSGGEAFPRDHPIPDQHGMASTAAPALAPTRDGAANADN